MEEDYSDLDPNKVVLSFRGRGEGTELNIVDKCLEQILVQRRKEASVERAMSSTSRSFGEGCSATPKENVLGGDGDESDLEIGQVSTPNVNVHA